MKNIAFGILIAIICATGWFADDNTYAEESTHRTIWKLQKDTPLNGIAEMTYGHLSYVRMIALYNKIDPEQPAPKGSIINTPELPSLFADLGLIPLYQLQFERIFKVIIRYRTLLPEYSKLRRAANGYYRAGHMELPSSISKEMNDLAAMIEETVTDIKSMTNAKGNTPTSMLRQFINAANELRNLAQGNMDGYGYDQDMVEQRIAYGLANAVVWSRE